MKCLAAPESDDTHKRAGRGALSTRKSNGTIARDDIERNIEDHANAESSRKVRFNEFAKVVLVPSLAEYKKHGLEEDLWWKASDMHMFRECAKKNFESSAHKYDGKLTAKSPIFHSL